MFFDIALIVFLPFVAGMARQTGRPLMSLALPLCAGLAVGHAFIPPTPGPIAIAESLIVGVLSWALLIRKIRRKRAWFLATMIFALSGSHMLVFGSLVVGGVPVQIVGVGIAQSAFGITMWSFAPDTVEYSQCRLGVRSEGVVFGSMLVVQKLCGGVMGVVFGVILASMGFGERAAPEADTAGRALTVFLALCPLLLLLVILAPVLAFPLNRDVHTEIVDRLSLSKLGDET